MKLRIVSELERIEHERDVRVLLAVESGSRAWGFASPDSDYDVRFIYAHRLDWYLSIQEPRDVIEEMLPGDLDVSGWELRKALRLFAKCNLPLNEWIGSPVIYRVNAEFHEQLALLMPRYFNAIAATYHYRKMASRALEDNYQDGRIGIKKIFYVLRPLLACRWIEHARSQPPTEFSSLVAADWVTEGEREWITELLAQKAQAVEAQAIALDKDRAEVLRFELARYESLAATLPPPGRSDATDLDRLMGRWVRA